MEQLMGPNYSFPSNDNPYTSWKDVVGGGITESGKRGEETKLGVRREVGWGHGCITLSLLFSLAHLPLPFVISLPHVFTPFQHKGKKEIWNQQGKTCMPWLKNESV